MYNVYHYRPTNYFYVVDPETSYTGHNHSVLLYSGLTFEDATKKVKEHNRLADLRSMEFNLVKNLYDPLEGF